MEMTPPDDDQAQPRPSPHSIEAEHSVLGALLLDSAALSRVVDVVTEASFYVHAHRLIFGAIMALTSACYEVDVITVYERLQAAGCGDDAGGLAYLNALAQCVPSASNIRRYAEIVADRAAQRALVDGLERAREAALDTNQPLGSCIDRIQSFLHQVEKQRNAPGARRVPLLPLPALREASESIRWLVKHVVPADSVGLLFGGSGTFKSFIALDLALHVAHGLPWLGRKTGKGAVIYIAAEGGAGLWRRIDAWHRARGLKTSDAQLFVVPAAVDLGCDAWRVVDASQLAGVTPVMVIVDTLSQTFGGEENSANEVAAYLRELGLRFRALWHAAVVVVHHSGHSATERPRGSSAIRGNVDFMFGCHRDEKEMLATLSCSKQKDGEEFADATFALSVLELGVDQDGDRITSLVARHLSSSDDVGQAMEAESRAGRGGKNQLLLTLMQNGQREMELRKAFYDECTIETADGRRQAYHRAKAWALKSGFFEVSQGIVITLKA